MSILIVDDTAIQRLRLTTLLKSEGYDDLLALASAEEAFARLGVDAPLPDGPGIDLILMDISMPDVDGIEACRRIKGTAWLQDIPIIMVTASTEAEELELAMDAGAMDYISKPVNKSEMLARVRAALQLRQEQAARKRCEAQLAQLTAQLEALNRAVASGMGAATLDGMAAQPEPLGTLARLVQGLLDQSVNRSAR